MVEIFKFRQLQAARPLRPYELLWGDADRRAAKDPGAADRIISEGWKHANFEPVKLEPPIAWEEVCAADRSWEYHLQSWDPLGPILAAYGADPKGRREQLDFAVRAAVDWAQRYPNRDVKSRFAWYDMSIAARAYRLGFLLDAVLRLDQHGDEVVSPLVESALVHAELMRDDGLFAEHSNHGFFFAAGQLALARRFPDLPLMQEGETQAAGRLSRLLDAHFTDEGVHREHSPDYHRRMLNGLEALTEAGLVDDPQFHEARRRIEEALSWFILPNARLAAFGDSDSLDMARSELVRAESLALRFATTGGREGEPPPERLKAFPESGYAVVRDAPRGDETAGLESYLAQACAFHSRSHKHADDLAFIWYDRGHELLVDAGRFGYAGRTDPDSELAKAGFWYSDPRRIYVESTRAHNTVEIDDRSHQRAGVTPYGSALRRWGTQDGVHFLESEVRHRASIRHRRLLLLRPGSWLIVLDRVGDDLNQPHSFSQRFHFAPALEAESSEDRLRISGTGLSEPLHVVPLVESALVAPARGQEEPDILGWTSPRSHEMTPCWTAAYRAEGVSHHEFATLLAFGQSPPSRLRERTPVGRSGDEIELEWSAEGIDHRVEVRSPPDGDLHLAYGAAGARPRSRYSDPPPRVTPGDASSIPDRTGVTRRALRRVRAAAGRTRSRANLGSAVARRSREIGMRAYRDGHARRARRAFRLATRLDPDSRISWLYLARAERNDGRLEESLSTILKPLARRPGWPAGLWHAADLQVQLGRPQDARRTLSGLDSLDGHDTDQLLRVGRLATDLGSVKLGRRVAEDLLEREPENHQTIELAATVARNAGDEDAALALAEGAVAMGKEGPLAAAVRIFLAYGERTRALALLPKLEASDPALVSLVARSLRQRGYLRQALELLDRAEADSELAELREQIRGDLRIYEGWSPPPPGRSRLRSVTGRVAHVTGSSLPHRVSGYTVRTHHVVRAQRRSGLDPHVLTQAGDSDDRERRGEEPVDLEHVDGIPYHRLRHPGAGRLPADRRLRVNVDLAAPALERLQPAVLHPASDYHNALIALSLREATDLPVVYEVRGFWEETWLSRQPEGAADTDGYVGRRDTETRCMLEADHVVTLAEVMKREIVGRGVPPEKVTVVPNAVDPDAFRPVGRDPRLADKLRIGAADTVVGYVGSLVGYEGLDDLIRAVALLRERGEDVRCLMVGDGRARTNLEVLAADLGVADDVVFTGTVPPDEIPGFYGLIDIFVLPRRRNRVCELVTPLKPFEAMAMECAVVVSDLDALREIVADGETGLVTPAQDPKALAEALGALAGDPGRRRALASTARDWVREERSWARNAEIYRSVYDAVRA